MPAEVAKAILKGEAFAEPSLTEGAMALVTLARKQGGGHELGGAVGWYAALEDADVETIIAAIGAMPYHEHREAARSMVERKLNAEMLEKMRDLEAVTLRLEKRAFWVGVIGVFVAIVAALPQIERLLRWAGVLP